MMLLNMYNLKGENIENYDDSKEYSDNTVFYKLEEIDNIMFDLLKNRVDGIFINSYYNNTKVRELIDEKDVIFLDVDYENTIFDNVFSNFFTKNHNILNKDEDSQLILLKQKY